MRLLITVTLNHNQFRAHVGPIAALPEVESIILVADTPGPGMEKVRTVVPPHWLKRIFGRAAAKFLTGLYLAICERPSWIIGYNLVPHGISAVLIARLAGARSYVHVIGGPAEWQGGGHGSDNKVLTRLPRPAPRIERLLLRVLQAADVVAVMGTRAEEQLIRSGLAPERVVVLPASVDPSRVMRSDDPRYDIVTASQLIPRKRLHELLQATAVVRRDHPNVKVAIAGSGPLSAALADEAERLGIEDAVEFLGFVEDVGTVYAQARIFVLPSQREGLSIAMTEAMAASVPVVVTDIGEVRDVVVHGSNGFLFEVGDVESLTRHLLALMGDEELRGKMSDAAAEAVSRTLSPDRIMAVNRRIFLGSKQSPVVNPPRRRP